MTKTEIAQAFVRPIITLAFTGAVIAGFFLDKVGAEAILGPAGMALGFWFRSRDEKNNGPVT